MKNLAPIYLLCVLLLLGSCAKSVYVPAIPNTPFIDTTKTTEVKLQIGNGHINTHINKITQTNFFIKFQ
jgi:hypothetical protein